MSKKNKKTFTLGEFGFAMKYEATKKDGDVMLVSKELWFEIAQLLIDTDRKLKAIEKEVCEKEKKAKAGDKE